LVSQLDAKGYGFQTISGATLLCRLVFFTMSLFIGVVWHLVGGDTPLFDERLHRYYYRFVVSGIAVYLMLKRNKYRDSVDGVSGLNRH
jgi:Na+/H+ antiporter NhaA